MDRPDPAVTWDVDSTGLGACQSTVLRSAVATAEHCLQLWSDFSVAATPDTPHITVAVTGRLDAEPVPVTRFVGPRSRIKAVVPLGLLQEKTGQLAALLIEAVIPAVVAYAEQHPQPEPVVVWQATKEDISYQPPEPADADHDSPLVMELETLEENGLLLIGRLDATPDDENTRRQAIDNYVCRRLDGVGLDGQAESFTTASLVYWTVYLPSADEDQT
jgi:hypothetical protein